MANQERNKSMGLANAGNVETREFFFPASGDRPAQSIKARSLVEAEKINNGGATEPVESNES